MYNVRIVPKVLVALLSAGLAVPAVAAEKRFEVTPMAGYRDGGKFTTGSDGSAVDLAGDSSYALALNLAATEGGQYELFYSRQASRLEAPGVDLKAEYLHLGGTTPLGDDQGVEPYAAMGIGAARFTPESPSLDEATRWSLSVGGGVKVPLGDYFALRFELRGYLTWLNGRADLFCESSSSGASCLIQGKAETLFQYEALGGVAFRF